MSTCLNITINNNQLSFEDTLKLQIYLEINNATLDETTGEVTLNDGTKIPYNKAIESLDAEEELPSEEISEALLQMLGDEEFEDEKTPTITDMSSHYNEKLKQITGLKININKDDSVGSLAYNILKNIDENFAENYFKSITVDDEVIPIEDMNENQLFILKRGMKLIGELFNISDIPHPNETLESVYISSINDSLEILTMNNYDLYENIDETLNQEKSAFDKYVKTPFRKFMFNFLLENLKFKFGVDYEWVSNAPFKARLHNGIVQINQDLFSDDDPFHEYLHAIILTIQKDNPQLYEQLIALPQVQQLAARLSSDKNYFEYPEEEALVRLLSTGFEEFGYRNLFNEFLKWIRNLFLRLFNIKGDIITLDNNISNISNMLLDNNRYLLKTNYFKDKIRYNKIKDFKEFDDEMAKKTLSSEQENIRTIIQDKLNIIKSINSADKKYEVLFQGESNILELIRPTSLDLKENINTLNPALKHFGTISHAIFSYFLLEKVKNPNLRKENMIYELELKTSKKNASYYAFKGSPPQNYITGKGAPSTRLQTQFSFRKNNTNSIAFKSFEKLIEKAFNLILNDTNISQTEKNEVKSIYDNLDAITVEHLYDQQEKMLQEILQDINKKRTEEKQTSDATLNNLLIYSELFVHNYQPSKTTDLYGGTLDLFIVDDKGNQFVYDIKTRGYSIFNLTTEEMIDEITRFYSVQQSVYRELLSNLTQRPPSFINTKILLSERMFEYTFKDVLKEKLEEMKKLRNSKPWNDFIDRLLEKVKNGSKPNATEDEKKELNKIDGFFKNIVFSNELTDESKFNEITKEYLDNFEATIGRNELKILIGNSPIKLKKSEYKNFKIINAPYTPHLLRNETRNVKILSRLYNNASFIELLKIVELLNNYIAVLEDKILIYSRNILSPFQEKKLDLMKNSLEKFKSEKVRILVEIDSMSKDYDNNNPFDINEKINQLLKKSIIDYVKEVERDFSKFTERTKNLYIDLYENIDDLLKNIKKSIDSRKFIIASYEVDLKNLNRQILVVLNKLRSETNQANLISLQYDYESLFAKTIILNSNIANSKKVLNDLENYRTIVNESKLNVERNFTFDNLVTNGNILYGAVIDAIKIVQDASINTNERASYITFIQKSLALYTTLPNYFAHEQIEDIKRNNPNFNDLITNFVSLEKEANESYETLLADVITNYEITEDKKKLTKERDTIKAELASIQAKIQQISTIPTTDERQKETILNDLISKQNSRQVDYENITNRLIKFIIGQRDMKMIKIKKELSKQGNGIIFNIATEQFLPNTRSKYVTLQIFSLLENDINSNYATAYKDLVDEIQDESSKFLAAYNDKKSNKIVVFGQPINYEEYVAFEDLIAYTEDTDLLEGGINYLMEKDELTGRYAYQNIFSDVELKAIEGKSESEIRNYISSNNLVDKYKKVKTLTLIDRAKYNYKKAFEKEKNTLANLLKNRPYGASTKNQNENLLAAISNLIYKKFHLSNNTSYVIDTRKLKFKDYILELNELFSLMSALSTIKFENNKVNPYSILINTLFSQDLQNFFITNSNLPSVINNESIPITLDKTKLNKNKHFDKVLLELTEDINSTNIQDIDVELHEKVTNEVKDYYGSNYGLIAITEALENYEKYNGIDGSRFIQRNRNKAFNNTKRLNEISQLRDIIGKIESKIDTSKPNYTDTPEYKDLLVKYEMYYSIKTEEELKEDFATLTRFDRKFKAAQLFIINNFMSKRQGNDFFGKYDYFEQYSNLELLIRTSPMVYSDLAYDKDSKIYDLLTIYNPNMNLLLVGSDKITFLSEEVAKAENKYGSIFYVVNPQGYKNTFENGSKNYFDTDWDKFENNQALFNYYNYVRTTLRYLYSMVPRSELGYSGPLDLPIFERNSLIEKMEDLLQGEKGLDRYSIIQHLKDAYTRSITNTVQSDESRPYLNVKPIEFATIDQLRKASSKQNYQLDHMLQMLSYNVLLTKERLDKYPISQMIHDIMVKSDNTDLSEGVRFNHFTLMTGSQPLDPKEINDMANSDLTDEAKQELALLNFHLNKFEAIKKSLEETLQNYKNNKEWESYRETRDELIPIIAKIGLINAEIENINKTGKISSSAKIRFWINTARKIQLTYSLTGQFNNLFQGLIQTSIVASGSEEEMEAYTKSIEILNKLLFESKVLAGSAYLGNIITTATTGSSLAGIVSIPFWMLTAKHLVEKYKDIDFIKKHMTDDVIKALNMELNYNMSYDYVEEAKVQSFSRNATIKEGKIIKTPEQAIEIFKPFGFVKRAEKMIVIQNMLIQTLVTKVTVPIFDNNNEITKDQNGNIQYEEKSFWDIHGKDGRVLSKYSPYLSKNIQSEWERKTYDRMHRANGNYTSKYQIEKHWWGRLMTVYSKWMFETMRNYYGSYVDEENNLYTSEAHEGIMRTAYKRGIEKFYEIFHNKTITNLEPKLEIIPISYETDAKGFTKYFAGIGSALFDRIIIQDKGKIIWNSSIKVNFVKEYNRIVENYLAEDSKDNERAYIEQLELLIKTNNIKVFKDMTPEEKTEMITDLKNTLLSFILPYDFGESFRKRTVTRNVKDRLTNRFGNDAGLSGYDKLRHANMRRFFNTAHTLYSMFLTKTFLLIVFGYLTKVVGYDDDDEGIQSMRFIINRYGQMWNDMSFYSNPVSAFYKYFHNGFSTVKFVLDLGQLNVDIAAAMPHLINAMLGDSEIGDITLEAMGLRDPILEKSKGLTNIRPVNDFIDLVPMINKLGGIYKQSQQTYN